MREKVHTKGVKSLIYDVVDKDFLGIRDGATMQHFNPSLERIRQIQDSRGSAWQTNCNFALGYLD
ncbi:MAG: hypothetical protein ACI9WC_002701 [Arenicella sp.]|jgi:hypothetical protein